MIDIYISREDTTVTGFSVKGHSDYSKKGTDIVCSAVSVLAINCINSIESYTDVDIEYQCQDGFIKLRLVGDVTDGAKLLLDSFVLGIRSIMKNDVYAKNIRYHDNESRFLLKDS